MLALLIGYYWNPAVARVLQEVAEYKLRHGWAFVVLAAVAAGALVVIGYGLSARLLPALLTFARSTSAQGRLEQPLTYWNAIGAVAAIGLALSAHLAGEGLAGKTSAGKELAPPLRARTHELHRVR